VTSHPRGDAPLGMSAQLLTGNAGAQDLTAGYPVHRVLTWGTWSNPHGAVFLCWQAACGARDEASTERLGRVYQALAGELCSACWPKTSLRRV
jgi:hypothetical protein